MARPQCETPLVYFCDHRRDKIHKKNKDLLPPPPFHTQSPSLPWRSNLSVKYPKLQVLGPSFLSPRSPKKLGTKIKSQDENSTHEKEQTKLGSSSSKLVLLTWFSTPHLELPSLLAHIFHQIKSSLKWNLANWVHSLCAVTLYWGWTRDHRFKIRAKDWMTSKVTWLQIWVKSGGWAWLLPSHAKLWAILELSLKSLILETNAQNSAWDGFSNLFSSRFELEFVLRSKGRIFFWLRVNHMGSSCMYAKLGLPNPSLGYIAHNSIVKIVFLCSHHTGREACRSSPVFDLSIVSFSLASFLQWNMMEKPKKKKSFIYVCGIKGRRSDTNFKRGLESPTILGLFVWGLMFHLLPSVPNRFETVCGRFFNNHQFQVFEEHRNQMNRQFRVFETHRTQKNRQFRVFETHRTQRNRQFRVFETHRNQKNPQFGVFETHPSQKNHQFWVSKHLWNWRIASSRQSKKQSE